MEKEEEQAPNTVKVNIMNAATYLQDADGNLTEVVPTKEEANKEE